MVLPVCLNLVLRPQMLLLLLWYFHFVSSDFYMCVNCTLHCWGPAGHDVCAKCGCHSTECINTCYLNLLANKGKSEQIVTFNNSM